MSEVRVRIAPSPTGSPHVGTAYIALFNYCFSKSQGGSFVLRIEDTDQARSRPEHEAMILDALRWTGLRWDEGPDLGGPYGPYRQSERTEHYVKHAQILLDNGSAYKCFCTPERLDRLRKEQTAAGGNLGYDGYCLGLTQQQVTEKEAAGESFTVRLKVPAVGECVIQDRLRGDVTFDYTTIDHQVLLKSDGFPTYHLANVVDDHLMKITHVIRGEEWLPSLPKHILLYEAFGWQAPEVIHLPLLRNEDKSKLSKRKNPTSILYYKELGILPEALINFLGMMAYTLPSNQEIFILEQMVDSFDIDRVHLGGPIFDQAKLGWVNQQHIGALAPEAIYERLVQWRFNKDFFMKLMPVMAPRMHKLGDFMQVCDFMFYSEVQYDTALLAPKNKELEDTRDFLQKFIWELETLLSFEKPHIERAFKKVAEIHGWSLREVTHAARVSICGKTVAPPLYEVMALLGSDICRNRMLAAVKTVGELGKKKMKKFQSAWQKASADWEASQEEPPAETE
ncbi:MAG: glutamate--tRNA ligase [Acidobacteriota bacterium]|nr:glutamate--tRNA ligase [Acidobacteriota bacterium]